MIVLGLILPLALGLILWFRALDQNPSITVPNPTMPMPNARDYYLRAAGAADLGQKISLLHQGFQYPFQELPVRSFNAAYPHYQGLRGLARVLAADAQARAARGDWNGAINNDLDAVQLGETMPRGGPIIGMLVGVACQSIGQKQAWKSVGHLNASQARTAAQRLSRIRLLHLPYADTLQEEKWAGQAGLLEVMRRPDWSGALAADIFPTPPGSAGNNSPGQWVIATRIRLTGKRGILENYTNSIDQQIAAARRPYAARSTAPMPAQDLVNEILVPMFSNTRFIEVKADTENALLVTTLALRAYQLDHGTYPPNLASLAPNYLPSVPSDPFALSGLLRYQQAGAKYLLYSVGPDGKDDGGAAIFDKTLPPPRNPGTAERRRLVKGTSQGDIVAGVNL